MNNEIKLSVLITFCKQNNFIKDALDSCINQKVNFNYEILIGLDNGDDEARKIIQKYISNYKNIKLFEINNSKLNLTNIEKASKNRFNLIKESQGEYITFLDGDDFYTDENRHQIMVDFLDNNSNYIAAFHDWIKFDDKTKTYSNFPSTGKNACPYDAAQYFKIHKQFSCFLYRNIFKNSILNDLNTDAINDSTLTYYFLRYGNFYFIPQKMFAYRIGIESIFNSKEQTLQDLYTLLCAELNEKYLPQHQKELCKKHKSILRKNFKNRKKLQKIDSVEIEKVYNFAKRQNCYFTLSIINYNNLNAVEKIKFNLYKNLYIHFKIKLLNNTNQNKDLCYFNTQANFGDELNLYIIQRLFEKNIKHAKPKYSNLIAIGSFLEQITLGKTRKEKGLIKIWGTGYIEEARHKKEFFRKKVEILALRGKYTQKRCEKTINKKLNVPLGDPGLLASKLIKEIPKKEYKVGIIMHYVDSNSSFIKNIKLSNYKILDITKNPIYLINEIAKCEVVLSSAMHGLITADSLNIPNQWIKASDLLYGREYKFNDYYSIFNHIPEAIDLRIKTIDENTIEKIKENYNKLNFKPIIEKAKRELIESAKKI